MKNYSSILKIWNKWKSKIILGLLILALGFGLRLFNLTALPIFTDEAIYIRWAQVMSAEPGLRFLPLSDGKQPLYMWVLMFLVRRFSDPLFIGRLTSVLYGFGTLMGVFCLSYYLFKNKKAALLASFICAVTPYSLFFNRMALVDSMLSMFGIWTLFFAVVAVRRLRADFAMLAGFSLGGALLTKSPGVFFALLLPTVWVVSKWPKKEKLVHLIKLLLLTSAILIIGFGMYNILRLGENFQMLSLRNHDYVYPTSHVLSSPFDPFIGYIKRALGWFWKLGPSTFILLVIVGIYTNIKKQKREILLLSIWFLIPILVSAEFGKVFTARYILFVIPFASILAAATFIKENKYKYITALLFIIFSVHALWMDKQIITDIEKAPLPRSERSGYLEDWTAGTGIREVSEVLREEYLQNPEENIVVGTEGYFGTLPDGLQIYLNDLPEITIIGVGIDLHEMPQSLIDSSKAGNKTYLVVNKSRLLFAPDESRLKLVAVYPKAFRPDGSRDSLYLFEVLVEQL